MADVKLAATARGDSSDLDFSGSVRGLAVKARGQVSGGQPIRLDLGSLTADGAGRWIALAGPATLTYGDGAIDIRNFALRVDSGRLSVSGRAGPTLDLHATVAGLPLAALDIFRPASASPASSTARRRSAERRTIPPATGACTLGS